MASALEKREMFRSPFPKIANLFPNIQAWSVGFDREWRMLEDLQNSLTNGNPSYPPYNIKKISDDKYEIEIAIAGFKKEDLRVELNDHQLVIEGKKESKEESKDVDYVYKGIASRHFRQSFALADHVKVHESEFKDGILTVKLESQVPEDEKPRLIEIK